MMTTKRLRYGQRGKDKRTKNVLEIYHTRYDKRRYTESKRYG